MKRFPSHTNHNFFNYIPQGQNCDARDAFLCREKRHFHSPIFAIEYPAPVITSPGHNFADSWVNTSSQIQTLSSLATNDCFKSPLPKFLRYYSQPLLLMIFHPGRSLFSIEYHFLPKGDKPPFNRRPHKWNRNVSRPDRPQPAVTRQVRPQSNGQVYPTFHTRQQSLIPQILHFDKSCFIS